MAAITLASLQRKSNRGAIKNVVDDLVRVIDGQIATQHAGGFSVAEVELPVNFNINGLSRIDAQVLVYSSLIDIYKGKGWADEDIGIKMLPGERVLLVIRWLNGMDDEERKHRMKLIESHIWRSPRGK